MPSFDYGHWDVSLVGEFDVEKYIGFVYRITHIESGKAYIGCKHLWKYKKRKKVAASEWRTYCSSSDYLKPEITRLGKEAFHFQILMLCTNRRSLYYNEMKLQIELGVLESDQYYNANIGGMRFFRPVQSYLDETLRAKLREPNIGTKNPKYRGPFYATFKTGIVHHIVDKTVTDWCRENKYNISRIYEVREGKRKSYKNIVKVEYEHERQKGEDRG